jgi:hypothetical protein
MDHAETTAARASALQTQLNEQRRAERDDHAVSQMSNEFFMSRIRNPVEPKVTVGADTGGAVKTSPKTAPKTAPEEALDQDDIMTGDPHASEVSQPSGFTPRGSYVDVRI